MENYENNSAQGTVRGDIILTVLLVALGLIVGFGCSFVYYNFIRTSPAEEGAKTRARTELEYASLVLGSSVSLFDCVVDKIEGDKITAHDFFGDPKQTYVFVTSGESKIFKREIIGSGSQTSSGNSNPGEIKLSDIKVGDKVHIEANKKNENNEYPVQRVFLIVLK